MSMPAATILARRCADVRAALERLHRVGLGVCATPLEPMPAAHSGAGGPATAHQA